jgi:hypothetical protein
MFLASGGEVPPTPFRMKDGVMGEFNKDPNQSGTDKQAQGDKPAFDQFEKGQQGQEELGQQKGQDAGQEKQQFGQEKGQDTGQDKQQFDQEKPTSGQQYAEDKTTSGQGQQDELTGGKGGQQQDAGKAQRQQGDEDLDEDSKSTIDSQGMK